MIHTISIKTSVLASPEYLAHAREVGRRRAGNELYEILYSQKLPAVVDIEEISIPAYHNSEYGKYPPEHELKIVISVNPVQSRHVVLPIYTSSLQSIRPEVGLLGKILKWIRGNKND